MVRVFKVALVAIMLLAQGIVYADAAPPRRDHAKAIAKLGVSKAQAAKLTQVLREARADSDRTKQMIAVERRRLSSAYDNYRLDEGRARNSIRKINRLQLELLNLSLRRQNGIRSALNQDQFQRLRSDWKQHRKARDAAQERPHRDRKLPDLNLAPNQQQAVERLWRTGMTHRRNAYREMAERSKAIQRLYDNYRLDQRAAHRLITEMNRSQLQLSLNRLNWQLQIRKILSEQQFKALVASRPKHQPSPRGFGRP